MKEKQTPSTLLTTISDSLIDQNKAKALFKFDTIKSNIDSYAQLCQEVEIVDDVTHSKAVEMLSDLNALVKNIDEKRKKIKERPLQECKTIDSIAKMLTELAEKTIADGRKRISAYVVEKEERERKEKEALLQQAARQAEEVAEEVDVAQTQQLDQIEELTVLMETASAELLLIKDMNQLKDWHAKYSTANGATVLKPEIAPDFANLFSVAKQVCLTMKDLWKDKLSGKNPEVKQVDVKNALTAFEQEKEETKAVFAETSQNAISQASVEVQAAAIEVALPTKKTPSKWDYELVDFSQVPDEFKCVDSNAVNEYIKKNKENLVHDEVRFGLKFTRQAITRLS